MKVVWHNTSKPNKSNGVFSIPCNVCEKMLLPFNHLGVYELAVGWTAGGYQYPFFVCSEECDKLAGEGLIKQKRIELNKSFASQTAIKMPTWYKKSLYENS